MRKALLSFVVGLALAHYTEARGQSQGPLPGTPSDGHHRLLVERRRVAEELQGHQAARLKALEERIDQQRRGMYLHLAELEAAKAKVQFDSERAQAELAREIQKQENEITRLSQNLKWYDNQLPSPAAHATGALEAPKAQMPTPASPLDRVLERLERIEQRLDRLEKLLTGTPRETPRASPPVVPRGGIACVRSSSPPATCSCPWSWTTPRTGSACASPGRNTRRTAPQSATAEPSAAMRDWAAGGCVGR